MKKRRYQISEYLKRNQKITSEINERFIIVVKRLQKFMRVGNLGL